MTSPGVRAAERARAKVVPTDQSRPDAHGVVARIAPGLIGVEFTCAADDRRCWCRLRPCEAGCAEYMAEEHEGAWTHYDLVSDTWHPLELGWSECAIVNWLDNEEDGPEDLYAGPPRVFRSDEIAPLWGGTRYLWKYAADLSPAEQGGEAGWGPRAVSRRRSAGPRNLGGRACTTP